MDPKWTRPDASPGAGAGGGGARDPSQRGREYLARVGEGGMPEHSLTTLTDLFEEARFSRHQIPESAPGRALDELEQARAVLAARDG